MGDNSTKQFKTHVVMGLIAVMGLVGMTERIKFYGPVWFYHK